MKRLINISNRNVQIDNIMLLPKKSIEIEDNNISDSMNRKINNLINLKLIKVIILDNEVIDNINEEDKPTKAKNKKK